LDFEIFCIGLILDKGRLPRKLLSWIDFGQGTLAKLYFASFWVGLILDKGRLPSALS
jgi:hypothetical protein